MKPSNATSGPTTPPTQPPQAHSAGSSASSSRSKSSPPSPIVDGFALAGASILPDPATHAYRKDLADTALAGRVIASHYAEPLPRTLRADAEFREGPEAGSTLIASLCAGDVLRMLDNSLGWAWGYAPNGRVGYVVAEAIGA